MRQLMEAQWQPGNSGSLCRKSWHQVLQVSLVEVVMANLFFHFSRLKKESVDSESPRSHPYLHIENLLLEMRESEKQEHNNEAKVIGPRTCNNVKQTDQCEINGAGRKSHN